MKIPFYNLSSKQKFQGAISVSIILFILKIILPNAESFISVYISEIITFAVLYFWILYVSSIIRINAAAPLDLIINIGILIALIFILPILSGLAFSNSYKFLIGNNIITIIISIIVSALYIGIISYMFSLLKELYFLQQKNDRSFYFNLLSIFFILTYFSSSLTKLFSSTSFVENAFYVVSIILILINSFRVAWIAFLPKKQKVYLLIISIVLASFCGINFGIINNDSNIINQIITSFSSGLHISLNLLMLQGTIYFGVIFFTTLFHLPTAEALDRKAEEVSSMMDFSKLITQVFDFKELAETVTKITLKVCNSDASWIAVKSKDSYQIIAATYIGFLEADNFTQSILSKSFYKINEVFTLNEDDIKVVTNNFRDYNGIKSLAVAPLRVHSKINGFLFAANWKYFMFDEDDKKAIGAFADYAAVALENSKLIKESLEKERLEKELDVAREIQFKILPHKAPKYSNLEISALFVPAFEVGGDYYDFFNIGKNKIGFVIADVSGKSISAAFIMAEVKGIFESFAKLIESPKELLIKTNEILKSSLEKKYFVTAIYGIIDFQKGILTFARAGHTPLIYLTEGKAEKLTPAGIGLGLDYGENFNNNINEIEFKLNDNDIIVLFTDGITEAQNKNSEEFGYERLIKSLTENAMKTPDQISREIMSQISLFSKDKTQFDDITLVIFKWKLNNKIDGDI